MGYSAHSPIFITPMDLKSQNQKAIFNFLNFLEFLDLMGGYNWTGTKMLKAKTGDHRNQLSPTQARRSAQGLIGGPHPGVHGSSRCSSSHMLWYPGFGNHFPPRTRFRG